MPLSPPIVLASLIAAVAVAPGAAVADGPLVIDPSALVISDVRATFGASAPRVRAAYARYVAAARAGRLRQAPAIRVRSVDGHLVDLEKTFVAVNQVNIALHLEHKTPLTALGPSDAIPLTSAASSREALARLLPSPYHFITRVATAAPPVPVVVPPDAKFCSAPSRAPAPLDADAAWAEVNAFEAGGSADRCTLSFVHALDDAELHAPPPGPENVRLSEAESFRYGNSSLNAVMQPVYAFGSNAGGATIHIEDRLSAHAFGFADDLQLLSVAADLADPLQQPPSLKIAISAASAPVYSGTFGTTQTAPFGLTAVAPARDITLFDPVTADFSAFGAPLTFQLSATGKVGLDGAVRTSPTGVYVSAKPVVVVDIGGRLTASAGVASATVSGKIELIDLQGNVGLIAALVKDPTASAFLPGTFARTTPIVALYKQFGSVSYRAITGSIDVSYKIVGLKLRAPIRIFKTKSAGATISLDRPWRAAYVGNVLLPVTPAAAVPVTMSR